MSGRKTSSPDACTAIWRPPPNAVRRISPSFCSCPASARGPSGRGPGRRGRAWRTLPIQRSGAVFDCPWWQRPPSLSCAAEGLRSHHRRAEDRRAKGQARSIRRAGGDQSLRQARRLERNISGPSVEALFAEERAARINMAAEAYSAPSCRPLRPRGKQESASGEGKAALVSNRGWRMTACSSLRVTRHCHTRT